MGLTTFIFSLAALALVLQGWRIFRAPAPTPDLRCFGWITLVVTALAILLHVLIAVGTMVISTELGIAMVQGGELARMGLRSILLLIAVIGGLGWHVARLRASSARRLWWLFAAAS
jgi:hypothetical protein